MRAQIIRNLVRQLEFMTDYDFKPLNWSDAVAWALIQGAARPDARLLTILLDLLKEEASAWGDESAALSGLSDEELVKLAGWEDGADETARA